MADRKISDLTALTTPATGDLIPIVDISEAAAADKNKSITVQELFKGVPDGTAAAPGLAFESDDGNGIYKPGTDQVAISTGGTGRLFVDASGRVGIGTTSPSEKLSVVGNADFSGANPFITLNGSAVNQTATIRNNNGSSTTLKLLSGNIVFGSDTDVERLRIDSSGRVGIGTSSPQQTLHVKTSSGFHDLESAGSVSLIRFYGTGAAAGQVAAGLSGSSFRIDTGGSTALTVTSAGNVGVGTTSPQSPLVVSASGQTGFEITPSQANLRSTVISFDRNAGTYREMKVIASQHVFSTGTTGADTERLRIDSSGRVGIGTSSPTEALQVHGKIKIHTTNVDGNEQRAIFNPGGSGDPFSITMYKADASTIGARIDAGGISYFNGGNVGVGTTPATALHVSSADTELRVQSTTSRNGFVRFANTSGSMSIGMSGAASNTLLTYDRTNSHHVHEYLGGASGYHIWYQNGSERARIDSSGRLLVGTSSPSATVLGSTNIGPLFFIEQPSANASAGIIRTSNNASGSSLILAKSRGASAAIVSSGDQLGNIEFIGADGADFGSTAARIEAFVDGTPGSNDMPGRLVFSTTADGASSPTERMRITSAGFLKASNNSTYISATGTYHEIANSVSSHDTLRITSRATSAPYGASIEFPLVAPDNNSSYFITCEDSATVRMRVYSDGDVVNHDNTYGSISDQKLKQDIVDAGSQWDDLKNLRVRKFKFISDVEAYGDNAKTLIGLVAQEAETVSPGLVKESPDLDAENNDLGTTTKSVNYSVLYMKAVKALQEAMERIETLEAKVSALEAN